MPVVKHRPQTRFRVDSVRTNADHLVHGRSFF
jgi:hypothetical protein